MGSVGWLIDASQHTANGSGVRQYVGGCSIIIGISIIGITSSGPPRGVPGLLVKVLGEVLVLDAAVLERGQRPDLLLL
jgi:hypothetical protein